MSLELQQVGLFCEADKLDVAGTVVCEYPVQLTRHNTFYNYCSFGAFTYVNPHGTFSNVSFGRYCSVAPGAWFGPGGHDVHAFSTHPFIFDHEPNMTAWFGNFEPYRRIVGTSPYSGHEPVDPTRADIIVGNDVWIGGRVMVMPGVTIGDGAVIAGGAVVTKNVEPYTIVGGVPAKVIRKRFSDDLIRQFLDLQWWQYDMAQVSNRVDYGKPQEVIDFMRREIEQNRLPVLTHQKVQLRRNGGGIDVTLV